MALETINPTNGAVTARFPTWNDAQIEAALARAAAAGPGWQAASFPERGALFKAAAGELRANLAHYAGLITLEMGKAIREARAEIEKCAWTCDYFAGHAQRFLADEVVESDAGRSLVAYLPLGTVLAIMPWNFPFWQVFRFAATGLMAGNTALLKHASNVPQCALAIEEVFTKAGFPAGVMQTCLITPAQTEALIADPRIHAVTLTGSEAAGRRVAGIAGAQLKKSVLELGGSDAFVVLPDADLELASTLGVAARYQNAGQSCIAAKRFILVESIADRFIGLFRAKAQALKLGDPALEATDMGPLARPDLRNALQEQVSASIERGAVAAFGCAPAPGPGNFYPPSLLDRVQPGMRAYEEELFGPVAIVIRARDEDDALRIANDNRYGLGGSIWTRDAAKGERLARHMQSGATFVNGLVKSDPRLPFGGVKASGYGRELAVHGIREFVNVKTIWIK